MKPTLPASVAAAAILAAGAAIPHQGAAAQSRQRVEIGTLSCNINIGRGFTFGSSNDLNCNFTLDNRMRAERYRGTIDKFGVDIGNSTAGVIHWAVFAPTKNVDPGALAGKYAGATSQAAIAAGLGANVLVGGGNSVALQPVSVTGQLGFNVVGGIASVELKSGN